MVPPLLCIILHTEIKIVNLLASHHTRVGVCHTVRATDWVVDRQTHTLVVTRAQVFQKHVTEVRQYVTDY